ncbi:hypothetical protein B0H10DRAFT_1957449 [Mycena sp. CBHHK59/15]|nr:hypothetical protein B0H10DRAFT_1957449 [Mycena sp. CBHHK59/15]
MHTCTQTGAMVQSLGILLSVSMRVHGDTGGPAEYMLEGNVGALEYHLSLCSMSMGSHILSIRTGSTTNYNINEGNRCHWLTLPHCLLHAPHTIPPEWERQHCEQVRQAMDEASCRGWLRAWVHRGSQGHLG